MPATITGLYVRHVSDADKLFHAVKLGMLPLVRRRLDAEDRAALKPGCIYVWEESKDGVNFDGIKRFTDGITWDPSRTWDGFLVYLERKKSPGMKKLPVGARVRTNGPLDMRGNGTGDGMIKKTCSRFVIINGTRRSWHINAYYTETAIQTLQTVDDIPPLRDLVVSVEFHRSTKVKRAPSNEGNPYRYSSKVVGTSNTAVLRSSPRAPADYMTPLPTVPVASPVMSVDMNESSVCHKSSSTLSMPGFSRSSSNGRSSQQHPAYFWPVDASTSAPRLPNRSPHASLYYGPPNYSSFGMRSEYASFVQTSQGFHESSVDLFPILHDYSIPAAQLSQATAPSADPRSHSTSSTTYYHPDSSVGQGSAGEDLCSPLHTFANDLGICQTPAAQLSEATAPSQTVDPGPHPTSPTAYYHPSSRVGPSPMVNDLDPHLDLFANHFGTFPRSPQRHALSFDQSFPESTQSTLAVDVDELMSWLPF